MQRLLPAAALLPALALCAAASPGPGRPLNAVVVDLCSTGAGRLGAYGARAGETPRLDALAREAAVFERALAQSSASLPNAATLLTGHVPEVHGLETDDPGPRLAASEATLAERLADRGYRSAAFGGASCLAPGRGLERGFDAFVSGPGAASGALSWLRQSSGRPFFLYVALDESAAGPGGLARLDAAVGAIDDSLGALGLRGRTLLIVTADRGGAPGAPGGSLSEAVLHVPLIVRHPGFPASAGRRVGELVQRTDLAPTLLDAAWAPYADWEPQGRSLAPLLADPRAPWRAFAFAGSRERVARTWRWKLLWRPGAKAFALYDLQSGAGEARDVSGAHPGLVAQLSFELLRHAELARPHAPGPPGLAP